jgi:hypothetical protein
MMMYNLSSNQNANAKKPLCALGSHFLVISFSIIGETSRFIVITEKRAAFAAAQIHQLD